MTSSGVILSGHLMEEHSFATLMNSHGIFHLRIYCETIFVSVSCDMSRVQEKIMPRDLLTPISICMEEDLTLKPVVDGPVH